MLLLSKFSLWRKWHEIVALADTLVDYSCWMIICNNLFWAIIAPLKYSSHTKHLNQSESNRCIVFAMEY